MAPPIPLVCILGPTASGKTALAARLAADAGGEVVSADALAVYRGMDILTAKPGAAERALAPHHLIDAVAPGDTCHAARWLDLAEAAIRGIHARGRLAIVAGGTPLYVKLLLEGISAGPPREPALRAELEAAFDRDPAASWAELLRIDPDYAAKRHPNDRQRIVRALEVARLSGRPYSAHHRTDGLRRADWRTLLIGLRWDRPTLHQRIARRTEGLFAAGLLDEVRGLQGQVSAEARQAVGCKEVLEHLAGRCSLEEAKARVEIATRQLAKHQETWYRRFADIVWLPGDAPDLAQRATDLVAAFRDVADPRLPPSPSAQAGQSDAR